MKPDPVKPYNIIQSFLYYRNIEFKYNNTDLNLKHRLYSDIVPSLPLNIIILNTAYSDFSNENLFTHINPSEIYRLLLFILD